MTASVEPEKSASPNTNNVPNPGHADAVALGCRCPVLDNNRGLYLPWQGGYLVNSNCDLHYNKEWLGEQVFTEEEQRLIDLVERCTVLQKASSKLHEQAVLALDEADTSLHAAQRQLREFQVRKELP